MMDSTRVHARGNGVRQGLNGEGDMAHLPVGTQLELHVLQALESWDFDVEQSVVLDHLHKIDFYIRGCRSALHEVFRPLFLQVTSSADPGAKAFQFSQRARAFDSEPVRVYIEVVQAGPGTLNFRRPAFHNALYRVLCDADLAAADFLWVTLEGLKCRIRAVPAALAGKRRIGVLHTWIGRPDCRTREFGYIFTPDERQFHAGCRRFRDADELAEVRRTVKAKQRADEREAVVNLAVSFLEGDDHRRHGRDGDEDGGAVRRQRCPTALDIRLLGNVVDVSGMGNGAAGVRTGNDK